jgi:hypothetical protein
MVDVQEETHYFCGKCGEEWRKWGNADRCCTEDSQ